MPHDGWITTRPLPSLKGNAHGRERDVARETVVSRLNKLGSRIILTIEFLGGKSKTNLIVKLIDPGGAKSRDIKSIIIRSNIYAFTYKNLQSVRNMRIIRD